MPSRTYLAVRICDLDSETRVETTQLRPAVGAVGLNYRILMLPCRHTIHISALKKRLAPALVQT